MNEDRPKKRYGKKVIKRQKPLNKLTNQTPVEPEASSTIKNNVLKDDEFGDEQHDHKTVLDGKSKNIKTDSNKRIKRQKTLFEPEDDNFWNELDETDHNIHLDCKPRKPDPLPFRLQPRKPDPPFRLQPLKNFFDHDHNYCIAADFGFFYGDLIPGRYAKYFDENAMVPIESSAYSSRSWLFDEPLVLHPSSAFDDPPSSPSDGDLMDNLVINDPTQGLVGPLTRSKKKELDDALYEKMLAMESNNDGELGKLFKELDEFGF